MYIIIYRRSLILLRLKKFDGTILHHRKKITFTIFKTLWWARIALMRRTKKIRESMVDAVFFFLFFYQITNHTEAW